MVRSGRTRAERGQLTGRAVRIPDDTERHVIVGTTGSGKSVFGAWQLSQRSFDQMPWLIVDFKREPLFEKIPRLEEIRVDGAAPKHRGLYVTRPTVNDIEGGQVTGMFFRIWERENTGILIDEGYMIPRLDKGLRTLLTQGRSKHIPMINLSQKPSWISPFLLSESEVKTVFYLEHPYDIEKVREHMRFPAFANPLNLPDHHSYWYSRKGREFHYLAPCPAEAEILDIFDRRRVRRGWL